MRLSEPLTPDAAALARLRDVPPSERARATPPNGPVRGSAAPRPSHAPRRDWPLDADAPPHGSGSAATAFPAGPGSPGLAEELAGALGLNLTRNNPVWGAHALEKLRGLQHLLMRHAFGLPPEQRTLLLQAVKVLESAVALRLRLEACLLAEQEWLQRNPPGGGSHGDPGQPQPPTAGAQRPRSLV